MIKNESIRNRRWNNFLLNAQEMTLGKVHLESKPVSVMIPTGQRCNLKCKMCIDRSNPDNFTDLTFTEFEKFIPTVEVATTLAIYGWGEPFINPSYEEIFEYILEAFPGILLHISTNGTLLNDKWCENLTLATNCFLNISINSASKETYREIMGVDLFDKVCSNVAKLSEFKNANNSPFPAITLSFVMQKDNIHELPQFVKLAQRLGADDVLISDLMNLESHQENMSISSNIARAAMNAYNQAKELVENSEYKTTLTQFTDVPYLPPKNKNFCRDPWESLKIGSNGDTTICCYANRTFGNIFEQSVDQIWNSKDVQQYRKTVNTENPPKPCRSCPKKKALFQ